MKATSYYHIPALPLACIAGLLLAWTVAADTAQQAAAPLESTELAPPPPVPGDWLATVEQGIAASEYQVTWQEKTALHDVPQAYQAPNRAHNLRTYFTEQGLRIIPRIDPASPLAHAPKQERGPVMPGAGIEATAASETAPDIPVTGTETPSWELGFEFVGFGTDEATSVPPAVLETIAADDRIEYQRGNITEWYVNGTPGLEQGFTIAEPSAADADVLVLDVAVTGDLIPNMTGDGQSVEFLNAEGVGLARYEGLSAFDAMGRPLPARMEIVAGEKEGARIRITVEGAGAVYPVTIDPLITTTVWTAESNQAVAEFGYSASTAGDVNGDGYSDVIISAPYYDNGEAEEGRAYLYLGSAAGLGATAAWTAESNQVNARFGYPATTAGDVNGDGYGDVIMDAYYYDNGESDEGRAYVYHGSASGLGATAAWTAEGNQPDAAFGYSLSTAGDVNGDGYSDVIVGALNRDSGETDEGQAFVYYGSASGLGVAAGWTTESNQASAQYGYSVATAGDVNRDGYSDVIVGANSYDNVEANEGRAFVYHGSASGLGTTAAWTAESNQVDAYFGHSVATAGDVNGDGYSDVIVGARSYDNGETDEGRAYVYHGSASGLSASAAFTAEGNQAGGLYGYCVSTAGDVNSDGYSDVIVGAMYYDNGQTDEGIADIFYGSGSGLTQSNSWSAESNQASAYFGFSVATAGDVNGDGYSDVIVGAMYYDNGQADEGRVFVYYGSAAGPGTRADWLGESNQSSALFGTAVADAGDVNGDGYDDVIVGAVWYDNGQTNEGRAFVYHGSAGGLSTSAAWTAECNQAGAEFGNAVSTAGDVNGDGFDDVIVGAHGYDNGQTDEGLVYVYHGSASGLAATANWTAEVNGTGGWLGHSVSTAGDVTGDGYDDIIVGAYAFNDGLSEQGRAFAWYGSSSGLGPNGTFMNADWAENGPHASAFFGVCVANAGDVNNDGYGDVIIGAHSYTNGQASEGGAFVYLGGPGVLSETIDWSAQCDQAYAYFGNSVSGAGDVNGDGRDDVVIGAFRYTNDQSQEGRAFVYYGAGASLSTTPNWYVEGNQVSADLGNNVSAAGDLNADGYDDIVVGSYLTDNGSTDEGRVFVYPGSPVGLSTAPFWSAESNQSSAYFGSCVSRAGDVNGDGYEDLIVGAPNFDKGQGDEGAAFVYYGPLPGLDAGSAEWSNESGQGGARFGLSVFTAGDVNADGYDDVIVAAPYYDNGYADEGRVTVYHGAASGLLTTAAWTVDGGQTNAQIGLSVATAGDLNGDGYDDVIIAAPYFDNLYSNEGRVFAYHGSSSGLSVSASWTVDGECPTGTMGRSVASAGDVNRDGYDDVIIGGAFYDPDGPGSSANVWCAAVYHGSSTGLSGTRNWLGYDSITNSYYGFSVSGAGDVNGDTYDDVVVGAFNCSNGQSSEGRTYVYHGSASGLSTTVNWSNESNQIGAYFGYSVAGGGDVNGDGYADIIVGAPYWDYYYANEGLAFVYPGSASGLSGYSWFMGSYQANAYFGYSIAMVGDVNSDGFDDVAAGASFYDYTLPDEGQAYVFTGSAAGVSSAPHWSARGGQATAYFGLCVAPAGDINGDGAADFLVSAPYYDNGETDEGRAFVYYGNEADPQATVTRLSASGNALSTDFGDTVRVQIDFASGTGASTERATLNRFAPENLPDGATTLLPVGWHLDTNRGGYVADVTFRYTNQELGGADEAGLVVFWSATGAAGTWTLAGTSQTVDAARNEITVHGLTYVNGFYAIGEHSNLAPVVSLAAAPNPAAPGQVITFTTTVWDPDSGDTATAELDFGDGTTGSGLVATHAYTLFGSYTVTVTVYDGAVPPHSVTESMLIQVNQGNQAPVSVPGGPYTIEAGQTLVLDGSGSYDPNEAAGDSIVNYAWDINHDWNFSERFGVSPSVPFGELLSWGLTVPYSGPVRLRVTDGFGATNVVETTLSITAPVPPTVVLSSTAPDPTNLNPIPVTATFSEPVTGFVATDIAVSGGTAGNLGGGDTEFTFDLTPSGDGLVTAEIPASVCTDLAGNANLGSRGGFVLKWGGQGTGDGQMNSPRDVAVDSAGFVYVAEGEDGHRVQKFTTEGVFVAKWGSNGTGNGQFQYPYGITVDNAGNVYVADTGNRRVQKFSDSGVFITKWGSNGSADGQFAAPSELAVGPSGNVYVLDSNNHRVQEFTNSGVFVRKWGTYGSGNSQFIYPYGMAADALGNVYVSDGDFSNGRVEKFTATGGYLTQWGSVGSGDGQFSSPRGVAVDMSGNVYVADYRNNRVQRFTSSGGFLAKWGSLGIGDGQFNYPNALAVDGLGSVYVADTGNHRIQKFAGSFGRTYDGTPPTAPTVSGDASPAANTMPTWTWTPGGGGNGTFRYDLDSTGWTETTDLTFTPASGLSDGTHRLVVQERDAVGNWSVDSFFDIVVDTTPPDPPVLTGTTPTNDTTPTWTWTPGGGGNGTFRYDLDTSGWTETTDVSFTPASPLDEGSHQLIVQERDEAGNWSVDSFFDIFVDTTAPDPPVVTGTTPTNNTTPTWTWTAGGGGNGTFRHDLDTSGWTETTDVSFAPASPLTEGTHRLVVQERDEAGNWSADGFFDIVVEITPPTVLLSSAAPDPTNLNPIPVTATFSEPVTGFTVADITVTGGSAGNFGGGDTVFTFDVTPSGDGVVSVEILADVCTDLAGNANLGSRGGFILKWGSQGAGDGELNSPRDVAVDSAGFVYVAEGEGGDRVQKFTAEGAFVAKWGSNGTGNGQFQYPYGITVDNAGFVYVADTGNRRVQKFSDSGVFITKWGSNGSADGQFAAPSELAVGPSGNVYVLDSNNHRVQEFTDTGVFVRKWGSIGSGNGQFIYPYGMTADASGNVYVSDGDFSNGRVEKFTATGGYITQWGSVGSGDGQFSSPRGVAVDRSEYVYVADYRNNRVQQFTSSGGFLAKWGSLGSGDGQFNYPNALAVDGLGNVYVADTGNHRIQKFGGLFRRTYDSTPPTAPVVTGTTPTNDTTPTWTWTAGGGGNGTYRYNLDSIGWTETTDLTFTPSSPLPEGTHRLTVQERDDAGNWSVDSFFDIVVDLTPPEVVSIMRSGASPTCLPTVVFTVTFDETVTGVGASDFSITKTGAITGTSVSSVSGSGASYTVTVNTGTGNGTLRLDVVDDDSVLDAATNPLGGVGAGNGGYDSGQVYTIDKTLPLVGVNPLSTADTTPTLTGTVSDPGGGVAGVLVTVGGSAYTATLGSGTWTAQVTVPLFIGTWNVAAQATDTAGNVATDATTNELMIQASGGPGEVWVDFAWTGAESGTQAAPYNTLAEGVNAAIAGGTVKVKGNTARTTSTERLTITKRVRIVSVNGAVRIGVLSRSGDVALVTTDALDTLQTTQLLESLQRMLAGDFLGGGDAQSDSIYEPVLPFTQNADGLHQARTDSVLAVRLRHPDGVDPESLWAPVQAQGGSPSVSWQPVEDGDLSDLWVIVRPQDHWLLEDLVSLTVNGATLEGTPLEPVTYEFQVVPDDTEASEAPAPLAQGLDQPVVVTPDSVYAEPQQVWLPVPEGVNTEDLQLYYYHPNGESRGWYPAEQVEGWLVSDSEQITEMNGTTYYGFQIRHAGVVQLGIAR